jgi:hypothetical protein
LEEHVQHVDKFLKISMEQKLYENKSKCSCRVQKVESLGNISSHEGIKLDPNVVTVTTTSLHYSICLIKIMDSFEMLTLTFDVELVFFL